MRSSLLVTSIVSLGLLGACHEEPVVPGTPIESTRDNAAPRENVNDAPAQVPQPVLEADPRNVPTTDQPQLPAPSGPTAGTTPNVSPGKNDAPSPDITTGGHKSPFGQAVPPDGPTVVPVRGAEKTEKTSADLEVVDGEKLNGEVLFEKFSGGVRVTVNVKDGKPGLHGVHVHEKGDCSNIPGKSMGEHFAPHGKQHGLPGAPERHFGDLGNIAVAQDGTGVLDITIPQANLTKDDRLSLLGKALVIHRSEDKGVGKGGGSGDPIACAVIAK
jgi:Cu-Zn family superoxide dismutase